MTELPALNAIAFNVKTPSPETLLSRDVWYKELVPILHHVAIEYIGEKSLSIRVHEKTVFITAAEALSDVLPHIGDHDSRDSQSMIVVVSGNRSDKYLTEYNNHLLSLKQIPFIGIKMPDILNEYGRLLKSMLQRNDPDLDNPLYRFTYDLSQSIIIGLILEFIKNHILL